MKNDDIDADIILSIELPMILMTAMNMKINSKSSKHDVNDGGDDDIIHDDGDHNGESNDPDGRWRIINKKC